MKEKVNNQVLFDQVGHLPLFSFHRLHKAVCSRYMGLFGILISSLSRTSL